jgi:uncharacterized protein YgiM (DUF1202 family)
MKKRMFLIFVLSLLINACAPQAPATPTVDIVGTMAVQMASSMQTQTALAYSPTPLPVTDTPIPTETVTPQPTKDPTINVVTVIRKQACFTGPGETYALTSNILATERVEFLGIGSVAGWYVIRNPYFESPCWIPADAIELDPNMDINAFPTITP